MSLTYIEMKEQYVALRKTFDFITSKKNEIIKFYKEKAPKSMTFVGCGSGYCMCQSGELAAKVRMGIPSATFAAGDLMLNSKDYKNILEGTMIFAPSRSGSTSEVLKAIEKAKSIFNVPVFAVTCVENSDLNKAANFCIELPWAFDTSVCQTRTVTNLYTADLLIIAYLSGDDKLVEDINKAITAGNEFMEKYESSIKDIAGADWSYVVLLADGEMQGIANEGAVAFVEIAQVLAHYYHLLDVRHGPMVMINKDTLVVACLTKRNFEYQKSLIKDIISRGAKVITYSAEEVEKIEGVSLQINSGISLDNAVSGIPFIFIPQALAYYKAEKNGIDADNPDGLTAWIKL